MPILGNSISGNAGVAGATITLSGTASATTTSASDGTYSFGSLADGPYVVTPSMVGITFTPGFLDETVSGASIANVNLVSQPTGYTQTATVTDNFHRANAANLGANWTIQTLVSTPIPIDSNQATGAPDLDEAAEMYSAASFPNDQFCAITVGAFATASQTSGLVRTDITNATGYIGTISGNGAGVYSANLSDLGTSSNLGVLAVLAGAPTPGDIITLQVVGTLITLFYNGVPIVSGTSSTTSSGTVAMDISDVATQTDTTVTLFTAGGVSLSPGGAGACWMFQEEIENVRKRKI